MVRRFRAMLGGFDGFRAVSRPATFASLPRRLEALLLAKLRARLSGALSLPPALVVRGLLPHMGLTSAPQRSVRLPLRNRGVFPGDVLQAVDAFDSVLLGPGVFREGRELVATRAGILRWDEAHHRLWVENDQKRYIPALHDHVIGVVSDKNAEEYRLDIGAPATAVLPLLAFDGASKRNRPQLHVGSLVYCRVVVAHRDMEPEVSCKAPPGVGAAKDWVTRESVFGELQAGHVFDCPAIVCRGLMDAQGPLLDALADVGAFELAVGVNGRVWVDAEQERMIVLVQNAILQSQSWPLAEHTRLVKTLQQSLS